MADEGLLAFKVCSEGLFIEPIFHPLTVIISSPHGRFLQIKCAPYESVRDSAVFIHYYPWTLSFSESLTEQNKLTIGRAAMKRERERRGWERGKAGERRLEKHQKVKILPSPVQLAKYLKSVQLDFHTSRSCRVAYFPLNAQHRVRGFPSNKEYLKCNNLAIA